MPMRGHPLRTEQHNRNLALAGTVGNGIVGSKREQSAGHAGLFGEQ